MEHSQPEALLVSERVLLCVMHRVAEYLLCYGAAALRSRRRLLLYE